MPPCTPQAYLRLAKVSFAVQECGAPSACPTGQVPALDTSTDLVGAEPAAAAATAAPLGEFLAARLIVDYLKQKVRQAQWQGQGQGQGQDACSTAPPPSSPAASLPPPPLPLACTGG